MIAETADVADMAGAVTRYIARRLVERERAVAGDTELLASDILIDAVRRRRQRRRMAAMLCLGLVLGFLAGAAALFAAAWLALPR